jgi:hypothetical protein
MGYAKHESIAQQGPIDSRQALLFACFDLSVEILGEPFAFAVCQPVLTQSLGDFGHIARACFFQRENGRKCLSLLLTHMNAPQDFVAVHELDASAHDTPPP